MAEKRNGREEVSVSQAAYMEALQQKINNYSSLLYRIAFLQLKNNQDAEDVVQETFYRLVKNRKEFETPEHEKAWLIKVATNRCRDIHRQQIRHPRADMEEVTAYCEMPEQSEALEALVRLPDKLKIVIYLHYIEGYKSAEIAQMLGISVQAVKKRMQRGREELRSMLE